MLSNHPKMSQSSSEDRLTSHDTPATPGRFEGAATLSDVFAFAEKKWAKKAGVACGDSELSFGALCSRARAVSLTLEKYRVTPGDRIAILSKEPLECLTAFWGVVLSGAIFVPLNPASGQETLQYILGQSAPSLLFYNSAEQNLVDSLCVPADQTTVLVAEELSNEKPSAECNRLPVDSSTNPDTPAVILYTSGSTGHPKGVVLSHGALCRSGAAIASHYQWSSDDRFLNLAEFHTMSGLRNSAIVPFISGTLLLQNTTAERESFFKIIESIKGCRATLLGAAPIFVKQLNMFRERIDPDQITTLRAILCTGSLLDPNLVEEIYRHLALPVINYYGLTETAGFCAGYSLTDFIGSKGGIGFAVGSTMTVQNELGEILPCETVGELVISSRNLMLGYYREQELTAASLRNGKFHTGDIGKISQTGEIILVGRKKNFIKNAHTELVYFEEVEMALEQHPQVAEAAVCGTLNRLGSEELVAFIVPRGSIPPRDEFVSGLKSFLQERIGRLKVPQAMHLVESLPRYSTGKLSRPGIERMLHDS